MATERQLINRLLPRFVSVRQLTDDAYQFIHKSDIPTYHFQKSLRRLPIPALDKSCQRLLAAAKPILSGEKFSSLQHTVTEFQRNDGPDLQKELIAYDTINKNSSFISKPWFDMYLSDRAPCPVNYNPFMMFAADPDPFYNDQLSRATNFAISFGRMKKALDANCLAPEVFHVNPKKSDTKLFRRVCKALPARLSWFGAVAFKAFPLDMSQYASLFGGSRIPQKGKDLLFHSSSAKHFLVLRGGKFYAVDLFDGNGALLPPDEVHACLCAVLNDKETVQPDECVGSFTSLDRDTWAEIRTELSQLGDNSASLLAVDSALFALCLDPLKTSDPQRIVECCLVGDDSSNRWFDKCFQLIVDGNGQATINFEHSWGDGVAVLRLMEESFRDTNTHHFVAPNQRVSASVNLRERLRPIKFMLNESLRNKIRMARETHVTRSSSLQFGTVEYFGLNRDFIKKSKLSPDSVMQLAIQLAFYRLFTEFVPTYESCSTAAFLKGRTECIRSATIASREAVLAVVRNGDNLKERLAACSAVHSQLTKEAAMGQGFDRHLMGLRVTAERLGRPQPALFRDPNFEYLSHFVLSTSTLSTGTIVFGGFGPVVRDGFGIGYNVIGNKMGAVISSYKEERNAIKFADALEESLEILRGIIERSA